MLSIGEPFPTFDLEAHDGSRVDNASFAGRPFLVFFYPKASTPVCTREVCGLRDSWDDLAEAGIEMIGVSYDNPKTNRKFAEVNRLQFKLVTDDKRDLAKACGAARLLLPLPRRISYLVGADGQVLHGWSSVKASDHAGQVFRRAVELGLVPTAD